MTGLRRTRGRLGGTLGSTAVWDSPTSSTAVGLGLHFDGSAWTLVLAGRYFLAGVVPFGYAPGTPEVRSRLPL